MLPRGIVTMLCENKKRFIGLIITALAMFSKSFGKQTPVANSSIQIYCGETVNTINLLEHTLSCYTQDGRSICEQLGLFSRNKRRCYKCCINKSTKSKFGLNIRFIKWKKHATLNKFYWRPLPGYLFELLIWVFLKSVHCIWFCNNSNPANVAHEINYCSKRHTRPYR